MANLSSTTFRAGSGNTITSNGKFNEEFVSTMIDSLGIGAFVQLFYDPSGSKTASSKYLGSIANNNGFVQLSSQHPNPSLSDYSPHTENLLKQTKGLQITKFVDAVNTLIQNDR